MAKKPTMRSYQDLPSSLAVLQGFLLCSFCSSYYHKHPSFLVPGCFTFPLALPFLQAPELKYGFSQGTFSKTALSGRQVTL